MMEARKLSHSKDQLVCALFITDGVPTYVSTRPVACLSLFLVEFFRLV